MPEEFLIDEMPEFDDAMDAPDEGSLRDTFAAAALSGVLANPDPNVHVANMSADDFADMAYEMADAMMARREGKQRGFGLTYKDIDEANNPLIPEPLN